MTSAQLLVQYPEAFLCFDKFKRKLDLLLSTLDAFSVIYSSDPQGFISTYFSHDKRASAVTKTLQIEHATHAIVFDDGLEYATLVDELKNGGTQVRLMRIKITRVVNIKFDKRYQGVKKTANYEYIGRGSDWGNPYSLFDYGGSDTPSTREEVIHKYRYDFERGYLKRNPQDALALAGKTLGCFCKPDACHGDVLAEYLNRHDDGQ